MRLICDMHTHTVYSRNGHGKNTIAEMAEQARAMGMKALVISDHGRSHPFYGVRGKDFKQMRQEIDAINAQTSDFKVYLSVESNLIGADGRIDIQEEELTYCDAIYAGYHYGYIPASVKDVFGFALLNTLARFLPFLRKKARQVDTQAYLKMMDRYPVKMITHPGDKLWIDIEPIARKAAEKDIILEINPRHHHLNGEEIKIAKKYGCRFAINSDAHSKEALGKVAGGFETAEAAGLTAADIVNAEDA